jgi:hypothetical protein
LHSFQQLSIETIGIRDAIRKQARAVAKARHAERAGADQLEVRQLTQALLQCSRQTDVSGNRFAVPVQPNLFECEPQLQCPESAALLDAELGKPRESLLVTQVRGNERERVAHRRGVAHERASAFDRHVREQVDSAVPQSTKFIRRNVNHSGTF